MAPKTLRISEADSGDAPCWTAKEATALHIRPIKRFDEPAMIAFHRSLSDRSVYSRYFSGTKLSTRILHERLKHICAPNPLTDAVFIAEVTAPSPTRIVAVARLCHSELGGDAEAALLVTDEFQGHDLGAELFRRLLVMAGERGAGRMLALFLPSNGAMRHICSYSGMSITDADGSESIATLNLGTASAPT